MEQQAEAQGEKTASASGSVSRATLDQGRGGVLGIKAGMTQIYDENGDTIAVTVIDLRPTVITQVKTEAKDGYSAIQVGFMGKKEKAANRPEQGHAKKSGNPGYYHYQEFRLEGNAKLDALTVGSQLTVDFVKAGDLVDLTAMSKGKGFQGGMKRFHMSGNYKTHGCSVNHRALGSIGNRADPAKVFKNKKMPGQMGHARVCVQNIRVAKVDAENGLLLVHGSVPGPKSGIVTVRRAAKAG